MHQTRFEFVKASNVVVVDVGRQGDERFIDQIGDLISQGGNAETGVDQQIPITSADVPDIAAQEWMGVGLAKKSQPVCHIRSFEPARGDLQFH